MFRILTKHPPTSSRSAFTLVELLVVVAIITILIALLIPALARARDTSKVTVCAANQKQIGLAFKLYSADYDGQLPYNSQTRNDPVTGLEVEDNNQWINRLSMMNLPNSNNTQAQPYLNYDTNNASTHATIMICPLVTQISGLLKTGNLPGQGTYTMNWNLWIDRRPNADSTLSPYPQNDRFIPIGPTANRNYKLDTLSSGLVLIGDGSFADTPGVPPYSWCAGINQLIGLPYAQYPQYAPWPIDRTVGRATNLHGGCANLAFVDAHVESVKVVTAQLFDIP